MAWAALFGQAAGGTASSTTNENVEFWLFELDGTLQDTALEGSGSFPAWAGWSEDEHNFVINQHL